MSPATFTSAGKTFNITTYPAAATGKRFPIVLFVHGNFGLGDPYGDQIHGFAKDLAGRGYVTAVPQYYEDDQPHLADEIPHDRTLGDAIAAVAARPDADVGRLGLIGFSLGAATAMTYIAASPKGTVRALADFFGFLTPAIEAGVGKFPPTVIFHNKNDQIVPPINSTKLNSLLPSTIEHQLVPMYGEFWQGVNHAFKPGDPADVDSQAKATAWFVKHLPPTGT
jgi:dienelactone hydrolase